MPKAPAGARRSPFPRTIEPELATLVASPPAGDEWLHEMKFDGYRILARVEGGRVSLRSRAGHDWTARFPTIAAALSELPARRAWIDGEATVVLADGTTSFAALQNVDRLPEGAGIVYFAFDLLYIGDTDLRPAPLEERKRLLRELLPAGADGLRYSDHVVGNGERVLAAACRMSLEGSISKRRDSPYRAGRGSDWTKAKCISEQEVVIGGFTEPKGSREGIGALLLGVRDAQGALRYAGKVGTGFTAAAARDLERPDRIVFDLDPGPGVAWAQVAAAAALIRERLAGLDLDSFVKTTGGKGAHVVVPLEPRAGWDECLDLSRAVSESLERDRPEAFLTDMAKAKRPGRILIDYARNHRGSTSVAAFSTRSRRLAPVSMPVAWDELPGLVGGDAFKLADVERILRTRRTDPWAGYGKTRQSVTAARLKKVHAL
jgi:DNA ligase D-like protein (predicted ligase)